MRTCPVEIQKKFYGEFSLESLLTEAKFEVKIEALFGNLLGGGKETGQKRQDWNNKGRHEWKYPCRDIQGSFQFG